MLYTPTGEAIIIGLALVEETALASLTLRSGKVRGDLEEPAILNVGRGDGIRGFGRRGLVGRELYITGRSSPIFQSRITGENCAPRIGAGYNQQAEYQSSSFHTVSSHKLLRKTSYG
jgi:hypothetical protein